MIAWIERTAPREIGDPEWQYLLRLLAPISDGYLRRLLRDWARESGVPLAPLVEGVRQESFEALESSLLRLLVEYEQGDAATRSRVRKLVINAKEHARWTLKRAARKEASTGPTRPSKLSETRECPAEAALLQELSVVRASSSIEKSAEKGEMILWMLTWLENPPVFPEWVRLRRIAIGQMADPMMDPEEKKS